MYHSLKTTLDKQKYLYTQKTNPNPPPSDIDRTKPRYLSKKGTDAYNRSLRRAFARAKLLAFFNPDLTQFITFTYKGLEHTPKDVTEHIKYLAKQHKRRQKKDSTLPKFKYMYVMEYQKRGSIHVHMIANESLHTVENRNGYREISDWTHGFSSVLTINDTDANFKPYLYLFKYMTKAERIGKSFIHISRNFDKIVNVDYGEYIQILKEGNLLHKEDYEIIINDQQARITKEYIEATSNGVAGKTRTL